MAGRNSRVFLSFNDSDGGGDGGGFQKISVFGSNDWKYFDFQSIAAIF